MHMISVCGFFKRKVDRGVITRSACVLEIAVR